MKELAIAGTWLYEPEIHRDHRGSFVSTHHEPSFTGTTGHSLFPVRQTSVTRSRENVVRGVHFTTTPPGMAKHVFCTAGAVLDFVVDLRVGSPTFGGWAVARLDAENNASMYIPFGVGHAVVSLADGATMVYQLSASYIPEHEHSVSITDPELALEFPAGLQPVMSDRDATAMSLREAKERGLLPTYAASRALDRELENGYELRDR